MRQRKKDDREPELLPFAWKSGLEKPDNCASGRLASDFFNFRCKGRRNQKADYLLDVEHSSRHDLESVVWISRDEKLVSLHSLLFLA